MSSQPVKHPPRSIRRFPFPTRFLIVLLGIVAGQFVLYAPSLVGKKLLLPLDILAERSMYLPRTGGNEKIVAHDATTSDLVLFQEPERLFAHSEISSGRFPLWTPYRFGGSPVYPLSLSPPWVLAYLIRSPVVLAWTQMLIALLAGFGAYFFCRQALRVSFWPGAIVAWCYPLTGAYIVWQGFWLPGVMCWLPWVLLGVDLTIRKPVGWGGPMLCALTAIVLLSGAQDVAGQVMLTSVLYAAWCCLDEHGVRRITRRSLQAVGTVGLAWIVGIMLSAWLLVPMAEYIGTGSRMIGRTHGVEERPPMGLIELPQLVLPDMYGSDERGSVRMAPDLVQESSVAGYSGLLATLLLAPLAFCSDRHRSANLFWIVLIFISMSWLLNVPGMVRVLRLPGLNIMSHNRAVFVTSFAILSMAALGLEVLLQGQLKRRRWFIVPVLLAVALYVWCVYRIFVFPEPLANNMFVGLKLGQSAPSIRSVEDAYHAQDRFSRSYVLAAVLAMIVVACWIALPRLKHTGRWVVPVLAGLMIADLLWFGYGRAPQCDPDLYYPKIPMLDRIASDPTGRTMGFGCLPANLAQVIGIKDIRGYDGVDPGRMVALLMAAANSDSPVVQHARTQFLAPIVAVGGSKIWALHPIFNMLNVRYIIFRGPPNDIIDPDMKGDDYWALVNDEALPRAFVPNKVYCIPDDGLRLALLAGDDFNPRAVAYVEQPVELPPHCSGTVEITEEIPTRVTLELDMITSGLVVLSDIWDIGWHAYLDGAEVPILRTNHAVRGVIASPGRQRLQFRYEPESLRRGLRISAAAAAFLMGWAIFTLTIARRNQANTG